MDSLQNVVCPSCDEWPCEGIFEDCQKDLTYIFVKDVVVVHAFTLLKIVMQNLTNKQNIFCQFIFFQ